MAKCGIAIAGLAVFIYPSYAITGQLFRDSNITNQAIQYGSAQLGGSKTVAQQIDKQVITEISSNSVAAVGCIAFAVCTCHQISRHEEAGCATTMLFFQLSRYFTLQTCFFPLTSGRGFHCSQQRKFTFFGSVHTDAVRCYGSGRFHVFHDDRAQIRFITAACNHFFGGLNATMRRICTANRQQFTYTAAFGLHAAFSGIGWFGRYNCRLILGFIHVTVSFFNRFRILGFRFHRQLCYFRRVTASNTNRSIGRHGYKTDFVWLPAGNNVAIIIIISFGII